MKSTVAKTTMFKKLFKKIFKQKPFIRFYTLESGVLTLYPIVKSASVKRKFMEDDQIGDLPETLSSKNCPGIKKIISTGWIVPAPADFTINTVGDGVTLSGTSLIDLQKSIEEWTLMYPATPAAKLNRY